MNNTLPDRGAARHRLLSESRPKMAHADLRKAEKAEWIVLGKAVEGCRILLKLSLKEFAAELDRDERQVARWIAATERTQVDAIFAVVRFRRWFVIALAEQAGDGVELETTIKIQRSA